MTEVTIAHYCKECDQIQNFTCSGSGSKGYCDVCYADKIEEYERKVLISTGIKCFNCNEDLLMIKGENEFVVCDCEVKK